MVRMDRSLAARSPAGGQGKVPGAPLAAIAARLSSAAGSAWEALRSGLRAVAARRRLRIAAICMAIALPVLGGGWLLLRHSSLTAVEHVEISGARGPQASAIEAALKRAAKGMGTLDVSTATLRAAVARFPVVSEIRAIPKFPHGMRIVVGEQPAVASILTGGLRTAVAGNGVALGAGLAGSSLPTVADDIAPALGATVRNSLVLEALKVLGAAPSALDKLASKAYFGPRGLTVAMQDGLLVYFGDAVRPHAKWLSLARVLADKSSVGAIYVDVRLPGRPAAGFAPGTGPEASEQATAEAHQNSSESTVAALAAGLAAANPETKAKTEEEESEGGSEEASTTPHAIEGPGESNAEGSSGESSATAGETAETEH
jgi:cell division septal protein FtsQ